MQKVFEHISILYVEDDILTLTALTKMLKKRVNTVYPASSGVKALELFNQHHPDIVITDISMPGMSGLELTKEIKQQSPDTPVVIITSYTDSQNLQNALNVGADKLLCKPVQKEELFEILAYFNQLVFNAKQVRRQQSQLSQLDHIIESSLMVARYDKFGNFTYANERFATRVNCDKNVLIGKSYTTTISSKYTQEDITALWKHIQSNQLLEYPITLCDDQKQNIETKATIMPLLDQQNRPYGYYAIYHDLTGTLAQQNLNHEKELSKTKDSFLVIFSHELKTPLNAILNFTKHVAKQLRKSDFEKAEQLSSILDDVYTNAEGMHDHIQSILDVAKLQNEKFVLKETSFDFVHLIHEVIDPLSELLRQKEIELVLNLPTRYILTSDQLTLKRIIGNIYSNAIKYGNNNITISLTQDEKCFTFIITDNGGGIKDKHKIFELFEQLDDENNMTRNAVGTGVGLHFVKIATQALNLTIKVEDNQPQGSKFILTNKGI
jgi:signal transduction histidine kinase